MELSKTAQAEIELNKVLTFWHISVESEEILLRIDRNDVFERPQYLEDNFKVFLDSLDPDDYRPVQEKMSSCLNKAPLKLEFSFKTKKQMRAGGNQFFAATMISVINKEGIVEAHGVFQESQLCSNAAAKMNIKNECRSMAYLTHEIRSSLSVILGFSELGLSEKSSMASEKFLETIRRHANHLLNLSNEIAEYSKKQLAEIQINNQEVDVSSLLQEMSVYFQTSAQGKELCFDIITQDQLPKLIISDEVKLRQVLINLIGNAIKFTEKGNIILKISPQFHSANEVDIEFLLSDAGVGIPKEKQKLIFNEFEQGGENVHKRYGGMGLGLNIASKLARALGGDLCLRASSSSGSTFAFNLKQLPFKDKCRIEDYHVHH